MFVFCLQGQLIQHNPKAGVIVSSGDLALQSVHRSQAGNYSCVASNVEGDGESNTVELKVMCKYLSVLIKKKSIQFLFSLRSRFCCEQLTVMNQN